MIIFNNFLISEDILETKFYCDIKKCKGICCVEGDSGPPITNNELKLINSYLNYICKFLPESSIKTIETNGLYYTDQEGDLVIQLVSNRNCVFAIYNSNNITKCAIQLAHKKFKIPIIKPISCHLYPIKIKKIGDFIALNLHKWDICKPGYEKGAKMNYPLYEFCKSAIIKHLSYDLYLFLKNYNK